MEGEEVKQIFQCGGSLNANGGENFEKINFDRSLRVGTEGYIM